MARKIKLTSEQEQVVFRLKGKAHTSEVIGKQSNGTITVLVYPGGHLFNVNRFGAIVASIL